LAGFFWRLSSYLAARRLRLAAVFASIVLSSYASGIVPVLVRRAIDSGILGGDLGRVAWLSLLMVLATVFFVWSVGYLERAMIATGLLSALIGSEQVDESPGRSGLVVVDEVNGAAGNALPAFDTLVADGGEMKLFGIAHRLLLWLIVCKIVDKPLKSADGCRESWWVIPSRFFKLDGV